MAEPIGALRAVLSASSAEFERDMRSARDSVRKHGGAMQKSMGSVSKSFGTAIRSLKVLSATAALAGAAGGVFAAFIKKQIDAADAVGKMAQATGNTTEFISAMGFVAEQTGTSLDAIAKGTQDLARRMDDFRRGTGEARQAFQDLGLTVVDGNGNLRSTEDVLLDIATKFKGLQDGTEKTNMAVRIFGESGTKLIPMLNQGRDGIEKLTAKAREMGLVISREVADQAAYLNDQINLLKNEATGFGRELAVSMLPTLNEAVRTIRDAYKESGLLTSAWVGLSFVFDKAFNSTDDKISRVTAQIERQKQVVDEYRQKVQEVEGRDWNEKGWISGIFHKAVHDDSNQKIFERNAQRLEDLRRQLQDLERQKAEDERDEEARLQASLSRMDQEAKARQAATASMRKEAELRAKIRQTEEAAAAEKKRIQEMQTATISGLEKERDLIDATTREEKVRWEISQGAYKNMDETSKQRILALAKELDLMERLRNPDKRPLDETVSDMVNVTERTAWAMQDNFATLFFDAFAGELKTTEDYYRAFMQSLLRITTDYMAQIAAQMLFGQKAMSKGGDLGGLFGAIVKGVIGAIGGGAGGSFNSSGTMVDAGGGMGYVPIAHSGLSPYQAPGHYRSVNMGVFAGAQRYHNGLRADEFPAILQKGEAVIPKGAAGHDVPNLSVNANFHLQSIDTRTGIEFVRAHIPVVVDGLVDTMKHSPDLAGFFRKGS